MRQFDHLKCEKPAGLADISKLNNKISLENLSCDEDIYTEDPKVVKTVISHWKLEDKDYLENLLRKEETYIIGPIMYENVSETK